MALPGNYALGYLEEDNPLKAYFRFRPLFLHEDGRYHPFAEPEQQYPQDGFVRIVPDKNESSHFKARMRQLGRYCLLDLREHAGANDKIRPNKNFAPDKMETNAYIVYSDVICALPENQLAEVLSLPLEGEPSTVALEGNLLRTACAFIESEGALVGPWRLEEGEEGRALRRMETTATLPLADAQSRMAAIEFVDGESARVIVAENEAGFFPLEANPLSAPVHSEGAAFPQGGEAANLATEAAQEIAAPERASAPWISRDGSLPRSVSVRQSARQTGLNPTRGRSLKEIIDEQWRKSRYDQLGHPVPVNVAAMPVDNPAETALRFLRTAWEREDARERLVQNMLRLDSFDAMVLAQCGGARPEHPAAASDLEAARLKIALEIDALRQNRRRLLEEAQKELCESQNREIAALNQAREEAKAALAAYEAKALAARGRALGEPPQAESAQPQTEAPSAGELISALRTRFAQMQLDLDNDEAVNLLAILCAGNFCLVSGPCGSGKGDVVRLLADALGLNERLLCVRAQKGSLSERADYRDFLAGNDSLTPFLFLLDDANAFDCSMLREAVAARGAKPSMVTFATIQDAGEPIDELTFDCAFTLRLKPTPLSVLPQLSSASPAARALPPVSLSALRARFAPTGEIPAEISERLAALRRSLAGHGIYLSRRALSGMWEYLARVLPHVDWEPRHALDRALAQRAIPAILASAPLGALTALPKALEEYPLSRALMEEPLPLPPL